MKQTQIRQHVFETNSSSSHSISIAEPNSKEFMEIWVPDAEGNINLSGGQFGWEIVEYNDAETKANYCLVDIAGSYAESEDDIHDKNKYDMLISVLKEQTGANNIAIDWKQIKDSYIDHQSVGTSDEAFVSKETLRQFIFNKESILTTDNDNH